MIQNISTIVTLTNAQKTEKYSNDVRSDLDLRAILPTSLPVSTLNEISPSSSLSLPLTSPPLPPPPASTESNGDDQEEDSSDDSDSNSDEE